MDRRVHPVAIAGDQLTLVSMKPLSAWRAGVFIPGAFMGAEYFGAGSVQREFAGSYYLRGRS